MRRHGGQHGRPGPGACPPRPTGRTRVYLGGHGLINRLGLVMMGIGFFIVLIYIPFWMWPAGLGLVMMAAGFLLWKFF